MSALLIEDGRQTPSTIRSRVPQIGTVVYNCLHQMRDSRDLVPLTNNDDIAFYYTLVNGREGIARAKIATPNTLRPRDTSFAFGQGVPEFRFSTLTGHLYRAEYKRRLSDPQWTTVPGAESVRGTGGVVEVIDNDPNAQSAKSSYYRAVLTE